MLPNFKFEALSTKFETSTKSKCSKFKINKMKDNSCNIKWRNFSSMGASGVLK